MGPEPDYSRAALARFIEFVVDKGLVHPATAQGWRVATTKVLEDLASGGSGGCPPDRRGGHFPGVPQS